LLNANEDVMKFNNVQELLQWFNQQEQNQAIVVDDEMAIIKIENSQKINTKTESLPNAVIIENELDEESPIELLPDATVIDIEDEADQTLIVNEKDIDIESLPDATVVKEEIDVDVNKSVISEFNQISVIEEPNQETKLSEQLTEVEFINSQVETQNSSEPITIIKYSETSSPEVCRTVSKEEIDFWDLLDQAMIKSTAVILKKHDIQITQKNMDIVKSEYYPNISLGYSGEYYHGYDRDGGSSIGGSFYPGYSQYRDSLDLSLSHELYRFGATDLKMQMSQKDIEIVKSELALAQQDISKELLSYFMDAVKSQENLKFKDDMRVVQDRILQKKWRLFESGQISKTLILRDQLSLVSLEKDILKHELNFIDAIKKIQILANVEINPKLVKFSIPTPKNREIVSFEQSAVAKNLKLKLEKKLQELELIKKDYKPTIYANSAYRFYGADDDSFTKTIENLEKNSWDVGVSLRWELFSGFKTDTTVEKAKIEVQRLVEQYRLAKVDFESRKMKRELLKEAIDKILRVEAQILDQTCQQEDIMVRLESAGQISSIEIDGIELNKLKSQLDFRLGVADRVYETISNELII
jgi:hypothetical protein